MTIIINTIVILDKATPSNPENYQDPHSLSMIIIMIDLTMTIKIIIIMIAIKITLIINIVLTETTLKNSSMELTIAAFRS